jgi:hypothetical protein
MTDTPKTVALIAMGASHHDFTSLAAQLCGSKKIADEVWAINAMGGIIKADRAFLMDAPKYLLDDTESAEDIDRDEGEVRASIAAAQTELERARAAGDSVAVGRWLDEIGGLNNGALASIQHRRKMMELRAGYRSWLPAHPGPVYSTETDPRCPGIVEYPLEDVLNACGGTWFNTTVAYAIGYALLIGVEHLKVFGCDFTYPDNHAAEAGQACAVHLLTLMLAKGRYVSITGSSTLMDAHLPPERRLYAYERSSRVPVIHRGPDGYKVEWKANDQQ